MNGSGTLIRGETGRATVGSRCPTVHPKEVSNRTSIRIPAANAVFGSAGTHRRADIVLGNPHPQSTARRRRLRWSSVPLRRALASAVWLATLACGQVESTPVASSVPKRGRFDVVAVTAESAPLEGTDAPPEVRLMLRSSDGSLLRIAGDYVHAVEFRDGQAAVTRDRALHLVKSDGSRSLLAREVDGLPTRAGDGSLLFAARFGAIVEIYRLSAQGTLQRLASLKGSATRLSAQSDGSVVFVGSKLGGVSGVWVASHKRARCLTNCELRVGEPWGDAYLAPPSDPTTMRKLPDRVEWQTPEGAQLSVPVGDFE